jgi:hypothetical protein
MAMREHRRGAATTQMTRAAFGCGGRLATGSRELSIGPGDTGPPLDSLGRRSRSECLRPRVSHDTSIHFSAPC